MINIRLILLAAMALLVLAAPCVLGSPRPRVRTEVRPVRQLQELSLPFGDSEDDGGENPLQPANDFMDHLQTAGNIISAVANSTGLNGVGDAAQGAIRAVGNTVGPILDTANQLADPSLEAISGILNGARDSSGAGAVSAMTMAGAAIPAVLLLALAL